MKKEVKNNHPSIFNNVIGPIMRGPSSSHTAAAVRIGHLARNLLDEEPMRAEVIFDLNGSLATTYKGQGSAMGFAGGLLGKEMTDPELVQAEEICQQKHIEIIFRVEEYGAVHPNTYRVYLLGEHGREISFTALSTGGGVINLVELEGERIANDHDHVAPLMPIQLVADPALPFLDVKGCQSIMEGSDNSLAEYGQRWEAALGGMNREDIMKIALHHIQVMRQAIDKGMAGTHYPDRILPRQAYRLRDMANTDQLIPAPLTNLIIANVTAIMESKSAMELIVAAPTAGSCGTLGGTMMAVAELLGKKEAELAEALMAAGLVGVFIAQQGGFAAEEGGCQYECGAASGMTAAALVELMGGSGKTALKAASMALQNTMGLICDPVADRVEVPCLGKNVMAALNGLAAANMALAGFVEVIPLGQVIAAMHEVGKGMDSRYRCTCKGGLSITPAAAEIGKKLKRH
ncbi:MAG: L-serine ammonia-lyase, iron-sulfur-dependent, subunit alpha [Desulfocapsaceae bacterium]|nr:L-serine ammonia-lyase, iron-sulfur-dependent, subunit alpha [Desulfocapsaceae bacterium]